MTWLCLAAVLLLNPFTIAFVRLMWRDRVWLHRVTTDIVAIVWMKYWGTLTDEKADAIRRRLEELERRTGKP